MLEYVDRARVDDSYQVDNLNSALFAAHSFEQHRARLVSEISELRSKLLSSISALTEFDAQPKGAGFTPEALKTFFNTYPHATIGYDGYLQLSSNKQPVFFHTARGSNSRKVNDDIIYATLPIYGFSMKFSDNGHVSGRAEGSSFWDAIAEVCGFRDALFGHPHVTLRQHGCGEFAGTCVGNNSFMSDWRTCAANGQKTGGTVLRILTQAMIWLESANLGDMYDTSLVHCTMPNLPEYDAEPLTQFLAYGKEIPEDHELYYVLGDVAERGGEPMKRSAVWCFWLLRNLPHLTDAGLSARRSLQEALRVDASIYINYKSVFGRVNSARLEVIARICKRNAHAGVAPIKPDTPNFAMNG